MTPSSPPSSSRSAFPGGFDVRQCLFLLLCLLVFVVTASASCSQLPVLQCSGVNSTERLYVAIKQLTEHACCKGIPSPAPALGALSQQSVITAASSSLNGASSSAIMFAFCWHAIFIVAHSNTPSAVRCILKLCSILPFFLGLYARQRYSAADWGLDNKGGRW